MSATTTFAAVANPVRRRILELLLDGPRAASDIAAEFALKRPAVSEHVHVLRTTGLITEEARGRQRFYHLSAASLSEVSDWLLPFEHYWGQRLHALKKTLHEEEQK
jgi:DNA-binding transcriptional ArsR family regulator